jgi:superfamily II DNA or RNA helicase
MKEAPEATFIGLSATPWAKGMSKHWDRMIVVSTPRKLIDEGYLSDFKFYAPASPDLTGVKTLGGDFKQDDLSRAMNKIKLVADIVTTWIERAKERPTLCFAVDCAHALSIQKQFEQAGISAGYIDAYTEVEEREAMIERLRTGDLKVICNVGTMTTGVDAPFVSCIILARPTKSEMLYLQIIGRGLRLSEGKDHCLILDHSDTGIRLGLPDQIEYYDFYESSTEERRRELKKKNKGPKEPKPCPKCQFLRMPGEVSCLACGFTPQRQSRIVCQSGELVELGKNGKATGQQSTYVEKQEFWSGLLYYAAEREYKRGWASYKFKEKFGTWPDGLRDYETYPTQQVLSFIRSRNIAWAKGKARSTNKPVRF